MNLVPTAQEQVKGVAARWKEQYFYNKLGWTTTYEGDSRLVYEKLCALSESATPKDVEDIVGNDSWTNGETCCEDGCYARAIVTVGQEPDYESATAHLCLEHLKAACALVGLELKP